MPTWSRSTDGLITNIDAGTVIRGYRMQTPNAPVIAGLVGVRDLKVQITPGVPPNSPRNDHSVDCSEEQ